MPFRWPHRPRSSHSPRPELPDPPLESPDYSPTTSARPPPWNRFRNRERKRILIRIRARDHHLPGIGPRLRRREDNLRQDRRSKDIQRHRQARRTGKSKPCRQAHRTHRQWQIPLIPQVQLQRKSLRSRISVHNQSYRAIGIVRHRTDPEIRDIPHSRSHVKLKRTLLRIVREDRHPAFIKSRRYFLTLNPNISRTLTSHVEWIRWSVKNSKSSRRNNVVNQNRSG